MNPRTMVSGIVHGAFKRLYSPLRSNDYRRLAVYSSRCSSVQRYVETSLKLYQKLVKEPDAVLLLSMCEGFHIHLQPVNVSEQPFIKRNINAGFDMQLDIFAWKE